MEATAKEGESVLFAIELVYGGLFRLTNIPPESVMPIAMIGSAKSRGAVASMTGTTLRPHCFAAARAICAQRVRRAAAGRARLKRDENGLDHLLWRDYHKLF